jgi:hypothetical protein
MKPKKRIIEMLKELAFQYPNDYELGKKIRALLNKSKK